MSNSVINTNVPALNSARSSRSVSTKQAKASARLSSGMKINSAADDAAGLAISESMRSQIRGLDMASKNATDGISLIQTADGAISQVGDVVIRLRELIVQAANDTNTSDDRYKIALEVDELLKEINATAAKTEFNTKKLLNGSLSKANGGLFLQIGANANQSTTVYIDSMTTASLGLNTCPFDTPLGDFVSNTFWLPNDALRNLDGALNKINSQRAELGANQNRLEHTIKGLEVTSENTSKAESRIRDADIAIEMMNLTKYNVLQQAANAMLAQANQRPESVMQLLRN